MLPQDFLYQLKAANPIDQIMGSYVQLTRAGANLKCNCPFHSDRSPSCVVYLNTPDQHFYCFGCHTGGDVITFLMKIENMSYMDAVRTLAERAGMTVPEQQQNRAEANRRMRLFEMNREAARYYYKNLTGADKRGLAYLKDRGLTPETIKHFGLGFAGDHWDGLYRLLLQKGFSEEEMIEGNLCVRSERNNSIRDRFRNRVMFPIMDMRGSVIAFGGRILDPDGKPKYLNSSDTPVFFKRRNLYAMNFAVKSQSKRVILAEGYMDVISLHQAGFTNAVASLGTALTVEQCRLFQQHGFEEAVIAYDSDFAGQDAALKSLRPLRDVGMRAYRLQLHDAKDPDEYIKKFGAPYFRKLLEGAADAVSFELERCKDGVDPATEGGTVEVLNKAVGVLAQIDNDMEREVYISKLASEYGISKQVIEGQIARLRKKNRIIEKKREWTAISTAPVIADPVMPDAAGKRQKTRAEELILAYLFKFPDELEQIMRFIRPENFVTALHRRIYEMLAEKLQQGYPFSLSLFSGDFTADEMSKITGILTEYSDKAITERSVRDAAAVLLDQTPTAEEASQMDDAAFADMFAQMQSKHRGT